ncbi:MAG: DNA mismatch repair protein MutS [Candidatus Omnitrophota bacterium]|jgi:flagellar motor component MotA|nr:MAG: DNA mismatch repair protein MutS [Candidatus Omnitrophota bacterium]
MKLKLNLYPIASDLEGKIDEILNKAVENRAKLIEIAYGKASEDIKKRILNFLNRKDKRILYHRLEKSKEGWGRIYIHFRWK